MLAAGRTFAYLTLGWRYEQGNAFKNTISRENIMSSKTPLWLCSMLFALSFLVEASHAQVVLGSNSSQPPSQNVLPADLSLQIRNSLKIEGNHVVVSLMFPGSNCWSESAAREIHDEARNLTTTLGDREIEVLANGSKLTVCGDNQDKQIEAIGVAGSVTLSPGHGYYFNGSSWVLQRSFFFGIVEDFINTDLSTNLRGRLQANSRQTFVTRDHSYNSSTGQSGQAIWKESARYYLQNIGAPSTVWNSATSHLDADIRARPLYANHVGSEVLVSLHNNGGGGTGTEIIYDTSNGFQADSQRLAQAIRTRLISAVRTQYNSSWADRGLIGSNGGYGENRIATRPAVIIELAFMDRQSPDNLALQDVAFRNIATAAIAQGIEDYFGAANFPVAVQKNGSGTGTITSNPSGINCGSACNFSFPANTSVSLTATPASGSMFAGWSGDCFGTSSCTVTMSQARNVTATFNTSGGGITQLQNAIAVNGSVNSTVQDGDFREYQVSIPAGVPALNVRLYGLSADADLYTRFGSSPNTATFDCKSANGLTTEDSCNIPNPAAGTHYIRVYGFATGPISYSLVASWQTTETQHLLTVTKNGSGSGTVISGPSTGSATGINCGAGCSALFTQGTVVNLFATAASGSTFTGWGGDCSGVNCSVTMNQARNVTANFVSQSTSSQLFNGSPINAFTNSVSQNSDFRDYYFDLPAGSNNLNVQAYSMSGDVDLYLQPGQVPDLENYSCRPYINGLDPETCTVPGPQSGRWFVRVYGFQTGNANFTVRADWSNGTTNFALSVSTVGSGSVTSNPAGINCPSSCVVGFAQNSNVQLTATPGPNANFAGWTGACSGNNTICNVLMTQARDVTANFGTAAIYQVTLTVNANAASFTPNLQVDINGTVVDVPGPIIQSYGPTMANGQGYSMSIIRNPSGFNCQFTSGQFGTVNGTAPQARILCSSQSELIFFSGFE